MIFKIFYHIAAMNNWKDVVLEQKQICDKLGLSPICGLLGEKNDLFWAESIGLDIKYFNNNLNEYEMPTLQILHNWCLENPASFVLYFHTKGVSNPADKTKKYWRWLMMKEVVCKYKQNIKLLDDYDIVGTTYHINKQKFPHISGNFWISRAQWINKLAEPLNYQNLYDIEIYKNPWKRMSAEFWICSQPNYTVYSLRGHETNIWNEHCSLYNQFKKNETKYSFNFKSR